MTANYVEVNSTADAYGEFYENFHNRCIKERTWLNASEYKIISHRNDMKVSCSQHKLDKHGNDLNQISSMNIRRVKEATYLDYPKGKEDYSNISRNEKGR